MACFSYTSERHLDHHLHHSLQRNLLQSVRKDGWQFLISQLLYLTWTKTNHESSMTTYKCVENCKKKLNGGMTYWEKNEGKEGALRATGLSFQECIWLRLMSSQRSAVAGAPALFQGPQGRKRGKRGNRESWARVWLAEMECVRTGQSD